MEYIPQKWAGIRKEPPISEPKPSAEPSRLKRAASPPLLPPEVKSCFPSMDLWGLTVRPQTGFAHSNESNVCGTFVFRNGIPPALRMTATS